MWDFPLSPGNASTIARDVDALFYGLMAVTVFFSALIAVLLVVFAIRYRRGSTVNREMSNRSYLPLELTWTIVPLLIGIALFAWGAIVYYDSRNIPEDALEIYVVGFQWMWKMQHPQGNMENNELHVPIGRPIKLTMTSQDIIHSFFVPAFRIKQDVLPGRYTTQWFEASKTGTYHLFCAEYCGMNHSGMIGKIVVMEPGEYERWLAGSTAMGAMRSTGQALFRQFGCVTCHEQGPGQRGPSLAGLFGTQVKLQSGEVVTADRAYVRESILQSNRKIVAGYPPQMPLYAGQIREEQVNELIEYIRSLAGADTTQTTKVQQ